MKTFFNIILLLASLLMSSKSFAWHISSTSNVCSNINSNCNGFIYSCAFYEAPGDLAPSSGNTQPEYLYKTIWSGTNASFCLQNNAEFSQYNNVMWSNSGCPALASKISVNEFVTTAWHLNDNGTLYYIDSIYHKNVSSGSTTIHYVPGSSTIIAYRVIIVDFDGVNFTPASISTIGSISNNSWNLNPYRYDQTPITYSISAVCSATNYNWIMPSGWTITSGQGTTSVTVNPSLTTGGNISVTASKNDGCNLSVVRVNIISRPLKPLSPIVGPDAICSYKSMKYTVPANPYFTNYQWTVPSGWIINGQGSNTIYITPPSSTYSGGGTITVKGSDGIDFTPQQQKIVGIGVPTPITYTVVTSANIENTYSVNYMLGSTLYKSNTNTTSSVWSTTNAVFHYFWPMSGTDEFYFKSVNTCGTSPIKKIIMHGNPCPGCPVEY